MFAKNKQKLKREDFVFENGWFETMVKMPGSLHMQQFQISDCEECEVFIFDASAGVFVDDCKYCTIFVGPSESSLFLRDCHYLNVICLTQQFRVRDCTNCNIWLWCQSQPIIESSHHLTFTCFPSSIGYSNLISQMKSAGLKLWNNNWFDIYDFTPRKFSIQNHHCVEGIKTKGNTIEKIVNKIKSSGLQYTQQIVPTCQRTELARQTTKYEVVIMQPVPDQGLGLAFIHSRTAKLPENMKGVIGHSSEDPMWLFVKIEPGRGNEWKRVGKSVGCQVEVISEESTKESLESTVFVPFADER